jgi:hypothetical protein
VSAIVAAVLQAGLVLDHVDEPAPAPELLRDRPDRGLYRRCPSLLLITARRAASS